MQAHYLDFDPQNAVHLRAVAELWNAACGPNLSISEAAVRYNVQPVRGGVNAGQLAVVDGEPVGVVLASLLTGQPSVRSPELGWIDAIAVAPNAQHQGIGAALLNWAESWLRDQRCRGCVVGASMRPFTPGVPVELATSPFFVAHGYAADGNVWDVAANLATYQTPSAVREIDGAVRPAQKGQEQALLNFLRREFPGRWRFESEETLQPAAPAAAERFADYMLLWTDRGVDGFCVLTFEDSVRPMERYFPYQLPRPWGQLGPVGVSADRRGRGYGAAVLDAGLRRLHNNGVNGCVIDWTTIVDFYAKFGFSKYREYQQLRKALA